MKSPEELDPDWARYPETILSFEGPPSLEIDLRDVISADIQMGIRRLGFPATFAVMTAHDPRGRDVTAEENARLQTALECDLTESQFAFIRVDACSPDRSHCECSVAVNVEQGVAVDIARRYEQVAIFWYDGKAFWLLGVVLESDPLRLPRTA